MHHFLKPKNKLITPPIFYIIMTIIFFLIGIRTISRGWFNTAKGIYERIITSSTNPIEFYIWACLPFILGIGTAIMAYVTYNKEQV